MLNYRKERIVGKGNLGEIWICTDISHGGKVIIKSFYKRVSIGNYDSFSREVDAMRQINHPNVIKFIDSFEDNENSYIAMEYVSGGDLQKLIENGPVDELVGIRILHQLLLALDTIHTKKIVHEDIKAENILLDSEENIKS